MVAAVSSGDITPSEAAELSKLIDGFVKSLKVTELAERIAKLAREASYAMKPRSRNLVERVIELERRRPKQASRFYMIWGKDDADCATKLKTAKTNGEVKLADRFDTRFGPNPPQCRLLAGRAFLE